MVDVPCKDTHSLTYECNEDFTAYIYRTPHVRQQERRSKAEQKPHSLRPTPAKNAMLHNLPNAPLSVVKTSTPRVRVVQSEECTTNWTTLTSQLAPFTAKVTHTIHRTTKSNFATKEWTRSTHRRHLFTHIRSGQWPLLDFTAQEELLEMTLPNGGAALSL
jgi:hypothetical protein